MKRIMKADDQLFIYSMGKRLRITAMFTDVQEANSYMEAHNEASVIAEFKPFIFIADRFDLGERKAIR
jgi:hypothetical protein